MFVRRVTMCAVLVSVAAWAAPKTVKISISNPTAENRPAEQIVIPMPELRNAAPGINAGTLMVTVQGAGAKMEELPSQVDDLDGDNKADELAFEIDLKPHQTRTVTVTYGTPDDILRRRSFYPARTNALFTTKIEGAGWESEDDAWRIYFDPRNAIDLYGKKRHSLLLNLFATPEYVYHDDNPYGRDIYKIGDALGIGAVGAWVDGKIVKVADVQSREYRIVSTGPVRAIVELTYKGWKVDGRSVTLRSRITQWAGDRGFYHMVSLEGGDGLMIATGLPLKKKVPEFRSDAGSPEVWLATYGEQVLMPGATATEALHGTNLGLAVVMMGEKARPEQDALNRLLTFTLSANHATWYTAAAWDREGTTDHTVLGATPCSAPASHGGIRTKDAFLKFVKERAARLSAPVQVKVLP
jgi:hypothetical protein